jgi:hypothetical protein
MHLSITIFSTNSSVANNILSSCEVQVVQEGEGEREGEGEVG